MTATREFKDVRRGREYPVLGVEEFMAELEQLQGSVCTTRNQLWHHVADGTLSEEYLRRFCKEYYFLGVNYTREFASLVANAPDQDALTLADSEHFAHWLQNLADETGYAGDANHVDMKVDWARMLDISDVELTSYVPIPETLGLIYTNLYFMRRSYAEGLAVFGWAGERFAAGTGYARMMYEGMRDHYGIEVPNFEVHAYAEVDHGDAADYLLRKIVDSGLVQHQVRRAVHHVFVVRNARAEALNLWLDEPGALR